MGRHGCEGACSRMGGHHSHCVVYVESGMEAMSTADTVEALSSWPSRNHSDGLLSYTNVVFYQGIVPWMLKWVDARCLLTM